MGDFKILLDGEEVHTIEDQGNRVEKVRVITSRGEASASAIDFDQDYINIILDYRSDLDGELAAKEVRDAAREKSESGDEFLSRNENAVRLAAESEEQAANVAAAEEESAVVSEPEDDREEVPTF